MWQINKVNKSKMKLFCLKNHAFIKCQNKQASKGRGQSPLTRALNINKKKTVNEPSISKSS